MAVGGGQRKDERRPQWRGAFDSGWLWAVALAGMAVIVVFRVVPALQSVWLSFHDAHLLRDGLVYVGWEQYRRLFTDGALRRAIGVSARYTVATVIVSSSLGLLLASALRPADRWSRAMYVGFLFPSLMPSVATALVWTWLYDPYFGLLNRWLAAVGVAGPAWLKDPAWALTALVAVGVWRETGLAALVFSAALARLPAEVEDAARVDGAGDWQRWRFVVLPLLRPVIGLVAVTSGLRCLEAFAPFFVMTGGGPAGSTYAWSLHLYTTAFERYQLGYASAMATAMTFVMLPLLWAGRRFGDGNRVDARKRVRAGNRVTVP